MKEILFLGAVVSIIGLTWAVLRPSHDFYYRGPNGTLLGLERLESDVYGRYRVHCKGSDFDGAVAPLLLLIDRLQKAGFKRC